MYKKIAAGILAAVLTFGGSALPAEIISKADNNIVISANAEESYNDFSYMVLSDNTVEITKYNSSNTVVSVPAEINGRKVTSIGAKAFYGLKTITKIELPETINSIGEKAFYNCKTLADINVPENVSKIGAYAFMDCDALKSFNIPNGLTEISEGMLDSCSSLESITIPDSVTKIGSYAFTDCEALKEVKIPDSVTELGKESFASISGLTSITLSKSLTEIADSAFSFCNNLNNVVIPDSVKIINDYAFCNCVNLSKITIPDNISYVGRRAFSKNQWVNDSNGIIYVGKVAYGYSGNLAENSSISLKNGTINIADEAFSGLALTNVEIPNTVKGIGKNAFYKSGLKSVIIPGSVEEISDDSFELCTSLESVTINSGVKTIGARAFYGCTALSKFNIPNGVAEVKASAFYNCPLVKTVSVPSSVTEIGKESFGYYYNNKTYKKSKIDGFTITGAKNSAAENYAGTNGFTFSTDALNSDIASCQVTLSGEKFNYTGKAVKPKVTVKDGSTVLTLNTDYAVKYINNVNLGTAYVKIFGKGKYTGSVTKTFEIVNASTSVISKCSISLNKTMFKSTGKAIKPRVIVKDGSQTLAAGTDYLVRYVNNVNPGTASVIIAGRGMYTGSVTKTFKILDSNAKDINQCTITLNKSSFSYTGKAVKPRVTVKDGGTILNVTVDYNVKYVNNINKGTATVVVSGTGKYQGVVNKTFTIL